MKGFVFVGECWGEDCWGNCCWWFSSKFGGKAFQ